MQSLKRALPLNLVIYGLYLLTALVITWPLVTVLSTHFAGYPFGDAHEMTRHIWWMKHALQTGQPLIFQPLLGYPDGMQGIILWSDPLQFFPGWLLAFFMPLPAAYNLFALLTLALNGWAAYWLVWRLTSVRTAGLLGGLAFMTAPVIQGHLAGGHGGLLVQWPLPLLAWSLLQVIRPTAGATFSVDRQIPRAVMPQQGRTGQMRDGLLAVVFFVLTPLGHTLQVIYAVLPLVAVIGCKVMLRRDWRALLRLGAVCAAGVALLGLFLLPVFRSTFGTNTYTGEGGGVDYSIDLLGVVTPSFNHPVYGQWDYTHRVLGLNIIEGSSYIGVIAGVLALMAVWQVKASRWWLAAAVVAWLLALGPLLKLFDAPVSGIFGGYDTHFTLPYALLFNLPGFSLARTPGRFAFLLALAVAVMAGYGWAWLSARLSYRLRPAPAAGGRIGQALALVTGLLIVFDYQSFWPLPVRNAVIPQAVYEVAGRDDVRAVFDVPWDHLLAAKDALWLQTAHQKPIIAGQVTRRTPVSPAKLTILEQTLNAGLLREAGADMVVVHKQYDAEGTLLAAARQRLGEATFEDAQLALFEVPDAETAAPTFVDTFETPNRYTNQLETFVYSADAGWLRVDISAGGNNRALSLAVDGQTLARWPAGNTLSDVVLPLTPAGYHVITVAAQPTCPDRFAAGLYCPPPLLQLKAALPVRPGRMEDAILFERGLQLRGSPLLEIAAEQLDLTLWWQFDQAVSEQDVRFIKVFDANGQPVAADDHSAGAQAAGSQRVESVSLGLPEGLAAGEYRVLVGWYTYPDLKRFRVLSAVEGAADSMAQIGTFIISSPP